MIGATPLDAECESHIIWWGGLGLTVLESSDPPWSNWDSLQGWEGRKCNGLEQGWLPKTRAVSLKRNLDTASFPNHIYHTQLEGNCPFLWYFPLQSPATHLTHTFKSRLHTQWGTWTHNLEIKIHMLLWLSQPGTPQQPFKCLYQLVRENMNKHLSAMVSECHLWGENPEHRRNRWYFWYGLHPTLGPSLHQLLA